METLVTTGAVAIALDWASRESRASWARPRRRRAVGGRRHPAGRRHGRDLAGAHPGRRRAAPPAGRRRGHLRRQPQHQLHQRLHQALQVLRVQPRPPRGGGLLPADRRGRAARASRRGSWARPRSASRPGLPPKLDGWFYVDLCRALKAALPELHLHAFSPEEVLYGVDPLGLPIAEYLTRSRRPGSARCPAPRPRSSTRRSATSSRAGRITRRAVDRGHHHRARARHPHDLDDHVRPRRDARALDRGTWSCCATSRRTPAASPSSCRCRSSTRRRRCTASGSSPASGPARPASRSSRCTRSRASCSAPTFRNIQASWVKEGPEAGPGPARRGRQRPGRHADQREHLHLGRRVLRPARAARRAASAHPRRGPHPRPARHAPTTCSASTRARTTRTTPARPRRRRRGALRLVPEAGLVRQVPLPPSHALPDAEPGERRMRLLSARGALSRIGPWFHAGRDQSKRSA